MRSILHAACALALLVASSRALAQDAPAAAAALELYEQGRKALAAGDLETACARFRASDHLEAGVGVRWHLGDCEERRGRLASAWEAFKAALSKLPAGDARGAKIQARVDALAPRLPRLVLTLAPGAPADTTVVEGATTLGASGTWGIPLPYDPGNHRLRFAASGRPPQVVDVVLVEGQTKEVAVGWEPMAAPVPAPLGSVQRPPVDGGASRPSSAAPAPSGPGAGPWIVGGLGLASLVGSAVAGGLLLHQKSLNDAGCSSATQMCTQAGKDAAAAGRILGPLTTTTLVLGAAGVAGGAIWLGVGGKAVKVGVAGAGVKLEGSW